METIKKRLTQIRGDKTYDKFAEELGIARTTYMRYEKGEAPSFELLYILCTKLKININWLLTGIGSKFISPEEKKDSYIESLIEDNNKLKELYSLTLDNIVKITDNMLEKAGELRLKKKNKKV
jgi:transcriptional regulator with XRE-family HTH domain